uniref:F-box domain-containing protein n=1 Tax=Mycena chlorophos TaxID=658473 RepID=A0ABQ0M613_MYCCL|nr:predicted protein [Mycena chlorophos]
MSEDTSPSSLLALARANLSKLEAQIEDLVARGCYPAATSLIGSIQPLLSPIHKLPAEVLSRIFLFACGPRNAESMWAMGGLCSLSPSLAAFTTAVRISHVSSAWRSAALDTPRMWATALPMREGILDSASWGAKNAVLAREIFPRSRSVPLPLLYPFRLDISVHGQISKILPRVDSLYLHDRGLFGWLMNNGCPVLQELRSLFVRLTRFPDATTRRLRVPQVAAFLTAANLTQVHINVFLPLPWSQLQKLNLNWATTPASTCNQALSQCTSMVEVQVSLPASSIDEVSPGPVDRHILPRAKIFTAFFIAVLNASIKPFLQCLALPSLTRLALHFDDWEQETWPVTTHLEVKQFLLHSPQLEDLALSYCTLNATELCEILALTPSLHTLCLTFSGQAFTTTLIERLIYSNGPDANPADVLVPRLRVLTVGREDIDPAHVDEGQLLRMIESRWSNPESVALVAQWEKIYLWYYPPPRDDQDAPDEDLDPLTPETRARVAQLKHSGLNISIL